jgi:hypothetical protein
MEGSAGDIERGALEHRSLEPEPELGATVVMPSESKGEDVETGGGERVAEERSGLEKDDENAVTPETTSLLEQPTAADEKKKAGARRASGGLATETDGDATGGSSASGERSSADSLWFFSGPRQTKEARDYYDAEDNAKIAAALKAGQPTIKLVKPYGNFEIRFGENAVSDEWKEPPSSGIIQVRTQSATHLAVEFRCASAVPL